MKLLCDDVLERSAVVANCRMNRERGLAGTNGYAKELGFHPLEFLRPRLERQEHVAWLDLCCGTGKALIEAARAAGEPSRIEIVGVDSAGLFHPRDAGWHGPRLIEASLSAWRPERSFDLITCVHGLHYVGDKLGLIARACSWLLDDGLFAAHLDLANLKSAGGRAAGRDVVASLRHAGLDYRRGRRLVICRGRKMVALPYHYLGADDRAGPNYTGQQAVDSYYIRDRLVNPGTLPDV